MVVRTPDLGSCVCGDCLGPSLLRIGRVGANGNRRGCQSLDLSGTPELSHRFAPGQGSGVEDGRFVRHDLVCLWPVDCRASVVAIQAGALVLGWSRPYRRNAFISRPVEAARLGL